MIRRMIGYTVLASDVVNVRIVSKSINAGQSFALQIIVSNYEMAVAHFHMAFFPYTVLSILYRFIFRYLS